MGNKVIFVLDFLFILKRYTYRYSGLQSRHKTKTGLLTQTVKIGPFCRESAAFVRLIMGGSQQILQSDWFGERAEFSHPARSRRAES